MDTYDWVKDWEDIEWLIKNELGRVLKSDEGNEITEDETEEQN